MGTHSGEGLCIKHPNSVYVLNGREDTWCKIKPDYMDSLGETFDVTCIGAPHFAALSVPILRDRAQAASGARANEVEILALSSVAFEMNRRASAFRVIYLRGAGLRSRTATFPSPKSDPAFPFRISGTSRALLSLVYQAADIDEEHSKHFQHKWKEMPKKKSQQPPGLKFRTERPDVYIDPSE